MEPLEIVLLVFLAVFLIVSVAVYIYFVNNKKDL
ncbi:Uncharacterised protein [Helicobacter fennelliae]|uniref:Uncharacterized protein n=1 Tax=Helicobacter fennelliae TaxID=215 RepID=A0A2X3DGH6_9HELI|nr:Uncharacterised protein [Helicobacter fennelliae]STP07146.1 Uncharacterised protein [Helicobacter fennelliae]STQ83306.1 Uncharacterised protein [Helicobacter fennelliae]